MLVSCPRCAKIYHIEPAELPAPVKMNRKGKGWFLSCQYCFHEWWFQSPQGFTWYEGGEPPMHFGRTIVRKQPKFIDQTNIHTLKNPDQSDPTAQKYHDEMLTESYSPFHDTAAKEEGHSFVNEKAESSFFYKPTLAFLCIVALALFYYTFSGRLFQKESVSSFFEKHIPKNQKDVLTMNVANVRYSVVKDSQQQSIHIQWDVINSSQQEEKVPTVQIHILGPCQKNEISSSLETEKTLCILKSWNQENSENKTISPGDIQSFSSNASLPMDVTITKVVVDIPSS